MNILFYFIKEIITSTSVNPQNNNNNNNSSSSELDKSFFRFTFRSCSETGQNSCVLHDEKFILLFYNGSYKLKINIYNNGCINLSNKNEEKDPNKNVLLELKNNLVNPICLARFYKKIYFFNIFKELKSFTFMRLTLNKNITSNSKNMISTSMHRYNSLIPMKSSLKDNWKPLFEFGNLFGKPTSENDFKLIIPTILLQSPGGKDYTLGSFFSDETTNKLSFRCLVLVYRITKSSNKNESSNKKNEGLPLVQLKILNCSCDYDLDENQTSLSKYTNIRLVNLEFQEFEINSFLADKKGKFNIKLIGISEIKHLLSSIADTSKNNSLFKIHEVHRSGIEDKSCIDWERILKDFHLFGNFYFSNDAGTDISDGIEKKIIDFGISSIYLQKTTYEKFLGYFIITVLIISLTIFSNFILIFSFSLLGKRRNKTVRTQNHKIGVDILLNNDCGDGKKDNVNKVNREEDFI